jgi:hypothetical protein
MYVENFKTEVIVFISNVIMCFDVTLTDNVFDVTLTDNVFDVTMTDVWRHTDW